MFISMKKHERIVENLIRQHANELAIRDYSRTVTAKQNARLRYENKRLKAQLEAKASFKAAQETPLPAPVPAVERPKYAIVHLRTGVAFKTVCGETYLTLCARDNAEVEHLVTFTPPQRYVLSPRESWCADCLG